MCCPFLATKILFLSDFSISTKIRRSREHNAIQATTANASGVTLRMNSRNKKSKFNLENCPDLGGYDE
jgi:hypothetical protein